MDAANVLTDFDRWLECQALAKSTRCSYRRWVGELVAHLDAGGELQSFLTPEGSTTAALCSGTGAGGWSTAGSHRRR